MSEGGGMRFIVPSVIVAALLSTDAMFAQWQKVPSLNVRGTGRLVSHGQTVDEETHLAEVNRDAMRRSQLG